MYLLLCVMSHIGMGSAVCSGRSPLFAVEFPTARRYWKIPGSALLDSKPSEAVFEMRYKLEVLTALADKRRLGYCISMRY